MPHDMSLLLMNLITMKHRAISALCHRHFGRAAEVHAPFPTGAPLQMKELEEDLGVLIERAPDPG